MNAVMTADFQQKIRSLQTAVALHGGDLTINVSGVYLSKGGETLANTWEAVGECLGESWKDFFGENTDEFDRTR